MYSKYIFQILLFQLLYSTVKSIIKITLTTAAAAIRRTIIIIRLFGDRQLVWWFYALVFWQWVTLC